MKWTYQEQIIRCGKPRCRTCPHGPYWYAFAHTKHGMKSRYIGKKKPIPDTPAPPKTNPLDDIFHPQRRNYKLACEIFGLDTDSQYSAQHHYKKLCLLLHPDRNGGEELPFKRATAAYEYIRTYWKWTN